MIKKNGKKIAAIAIAATLVAPNVLSVFALDNTENDTQVSNEQVLESVEQQSTEDVKDSEEKVETKSNNKITILHTNDMHGRFQRTDKVIGLDVVAAIKNQTDNSILVDAGDTTHGLPFVTLSKGQDAVDLLNATGYEYMAPGNHDFNYGYERLLELFQNAKVKSGSTKLRPLAGNIKKNGQSLFNPSAIKVMNVNGKEIKVGFLVAQSLDH